MTKPIHIITVAYALAKDLLALYDSVMSQPENDDIQWSIYLHSKHPDVVAACDKIERWSPDSEVHRYGINRGLARSWNDGWCWAQALEAEYIFIANDDATAGPGDIGKLIKAADVASPDVYMVSGWGFDARHGQNRDQLFSLCILRPTAFDRLGMFDQNFWPIYWEDIDWYRRAELLRLRRICAPDTDIFHAGSKSLFGGSEADRAKHDQLFHANRLYYERKWGGARGFETFPIPFNEPSYGLRIPAHLRQDPYPAHRRKDIEP